MTPGDAVRKKAQAAYPHAPACLADLNPWCECGAAEQQQVWRAGHAEGRAEGLEWAVSKYCRNKHDAECYNHETCPCERCCHYRPIHRELARLWGRK